METRNLEKEQLIVSAFWVKKVIDHIVPLSCAGSDTKKNKMYISKEANDLKSDKTKGKIGKKWRFAILVKKPKYGKRFGIMYIRSRDIPNDHWYEVEPII